MGRRTQRWDENPLLRQTWHCLRDATFRLNGNTARALMTWANQDEWYPKTTQGVTRWLRQMTDAEILVIDGIGRAGLKDIRRFLRVYRSDSWAMYADMMMLTPLSRRS